LICVKTAAARLAILAAMTTPKARMLALAAQTLGSYKALADRLGVTTAVLASWIGGEIVAPDRAFLLAIEIVEKPRLG